MTLAAKWKKLKSSVATKEKSKECIHGYESCVRCSMDDHAPSVVKFVMNDVLEIEDTKNIVKALPKNVQEKMRMYPGKLVLAGGFIRALIAGEQPRDIDLYVNSETEAMSCTSGLCTEKRDHRLEAINESKLVQVSWRYSFDTPSQVPEQFDYTVAKAAIWFNDKGSGSFESVCHERFYRDLARKALVYDCVKESESLHAIPRLLKYSSYGYRIAPTDLANIISRVCVNLHVEDGLDGLVSQLKNEYTNVHDDATWTELTKKYVPPKPVYDSYS